MRYQAGRRVVSAHTGGGSDRAGKEGRRSHALFDLQLAPPRRVLERLHTHLWFLWDDR